MPYIFQEGGADFIKPNDIRVAKITAPKQNM